jgi:uncharacterized protein (TIGR02611 family)
MNEVFSYTLKKVRRLIIGVVGFTILLIGIALLVLPGPAFIVIPIGLGLLATEFVWARKLLKKVKAQIEKAAKNAKHKKP